MMKMFIFIVVVGSTLGCMESKGWWECWIFLEMNSMAFIMYMFKEKKKEKIFIFLLFQTLASTLVMAFIFLASWTMSQNISKTIFVLISLAILMKVGMFPFHSWIMKVMKDFSWVLMMITFSWQKLIPIFIVMKIMEKTPIIFKITIMSIIALNLLLIKMTDTKVIMTISSLIHNTWVFIPLLMVKEASMVYLMSYVLILIPLTYSFSKMSIKQVNKQLLVKKIKKEMKFLMFSISGIPPSIGFMVKMFILSTLIMKNKKMTTMTLLVASSCMTFFVYLQMFMSYFFMEKSKTIKKNYYSKKNEIKETSWVFIFIPVLMWI